MANMSQDFGDDFYPGLKGTSMANALERACLGRPFQLGMLYDCNRDKLLPGKPLWDIEPGKDGHLSKPQTQSGSKFVVSSDDSFEWKCDQLDVLDSATKLSLLSGWVNFSGAAKLFRESKMSKMQARVILACKSILKMEETVPDQTKIDLPDGHKGSTHVVVGVLYGINMFFVFDRKVGEGEDANAIQANLEGKVRALTKPQDFSGEFTTGTELVTIKYYGDLKLEEKPTTFELVARLCRDIPKMLEKLNVPMRVWLHPLGEMVDKEYSVLEISETMSDLLQQLIKSLRDFEVRSHDLSNKSTCFYFVEIKENLDHMGRLIKAHRDELQKCLFDSLSRMRNGQADESELVSVLETNKASPFNCQYLSTWFDNKDKEVQTLDNYLKQLKQEQRIQFAFTDFDDYVTDLEVDSVLCFDFNIVQQDSGILQKMENHNNGRKVSHEVAIPHPWHKDRHVVQQMREQIHRFNAFVKNNIGRKDIKFVATNGESGNVNMVGVISLFERVCPVEFKPPDKPGMPVVSRWSKSCLYLSWDAPMYGAESVKSYTICYRSESDPPDKWCSKGSLKPQIALPGLLPDTVYYVKVKAETSAGSSPESIVSTIKTPPEDPGKPHAEKVTHNSILLEWNKPTQKSSSILSYTILYQSSCDPAEKWHSEAVCATQGNVLLSGLVPMTTYFCKVTAETIDGLTLESNLSEPIETMLPISQPGKPQASDVTHDGLKLSWSKPTLVATGILHYSIAFRSINESIEEWHKQATNSAQEYFTVSNLNHGTSYVFKVQAVTAAGYGPESDICEPIKTKLPISQPGKPYSSDLTHTSVKLKWGCPPVGANYVQSYTILYRSDSMPSQKWHAQQTPDCQQNQVVENLAPKTVYHFKIRAETATGPGPESELSVPIKTLLPPPGKLRISNVSHKCIELSWEKPACVSNCVKSYTVYFRSQNDKWLHKNTAKEFIVLEGLTPNTAYYLKVRAETGTGPSPDSELIGPVLTMVPPPCKPKVSNITYSSIHLSWKLPKCGTEGIQSYTVYYRSTDNSVDDWMLQETNDCVRSLNIVDLLPGRVYHFKVRAKTATGFSNDSSISEVVLPPDQPGKPLVTERTHNSIQIKWAKPKHGAKTVQYYTVWYKSDQSDQFIHRRTTFAQEGILLCDLDPKTSYCVKVQADNSTGTSPDSELSDSIETLLPPPGKPNATSITHNSVVLIWQKPQCGAEGVTSYIVSFCRQSEPWHEQKTPTAQEYLVLKDLVPKTIYQFRVRAETVTGFSQESELSGPIETMLPPPGKPYTSKKTHNSIQLNWEKPERGSESVLVYTVFSRFEHDPPDKWTYQRTKAPIEFMDMYKCFPGSVYLFKVRAETATGPSPDSDICMVIMPPSQPGTLQVAVKALYSIYLMWTKPIYGATSVQRYTVLYRSTADPAENWLTQSTQGAEEFMNVSNLLPGTIYNIIVRAEGTGGSSPDSNTVEAVLPPDQPGKPSASIVSHDKITLEWNPPKHGAEIVSSYFISYRPVSDPPSKWQIHMSQGSDSTTIVDLAPKTVYVFKVRAEAADAGSSPTSELSDSIETLLPPPGKPYARKVSYEDFQINWKKPDCKNIQHYIVYYRSIDDPVDQWCHFQTTDNKNNYTFVASPGIIYVFKVSAITSQGPTSESETSGHIATKVKPWGARLLSSCKRISTDINPRIYQLPLQYTMNRKGIAKAVVGEHLPAPSKSATVVPHKVLMVVGATGAGKSTLINGIANYIMGVDWEDEYRFKLISEETAHDQTKSQTKCITAYTFYKDRGSPLKYTLTVIDTPGFGDTGGLERDKQIVAQIKEFFSIRGDEGIDQLHGIGFVTQAPLARLTPTQQYVFDSILSVFGKDVADNIFLMVTFSDGKRPPILDAVRAAGVPFNDNFFKFNNSALFAGNQKDEFDTMFWKMGNKSFGDFFDHFSKAKRQSLQQSREVLQEREQLEVTIQGLQPQIRAGLAKIDELRQERQLLKDHEADIIANTDFTYKVQITKQRKIDLPTGRYTTNCLKCNYTCHDNCIYANDGDKFKCSAMNYAGSQNATCRVCPGQCSWRDHVCNPYRFEIYQEPETRTSNELKAKYDSALTDKGEVEAVMTKMKSELKEMDRAVLLKIKQAKQSIQRLEEIALRPGHLTEVGYIDILIDSEEREARPGWRQRVKALHEVRKQAEIVTDIRSTKEEKDDSFFPQSAHEFPQNQPEQQQVGLWSKFKSLWT